MSAWLALAALSAAAAAALAAPRPTLLVGGAPPHDPPHDRPHDRTHDRLRRGRRATGSPPPAGSPSSSRSGGASPRRRVRVAVSAGAVIAMLVVVPGPNGYVIALVAGVLAWRWSASLESAAAVRRRERLERDLPPVVDLVLSAAAAGAAPSSAVSAVARVVSGPVSDDLAGHVARLQLGADPKVVWSELGRHPQLGPLGVVLSRSADSGAPVVETLTRLGEDLRSLQRAEAEARVRQVEVRAAVPLGLCMLPGFILLGVVPLVAGTVGRLLGP